MNEYDYQTFSRTKFFMFFMCVLVDSLVYACDVFVWVHLSICCNAFQNQCSPLYMSQFRVCAFSFESEFCERVFLCDVCVCLSSAIKGSNSGCVCRGAAAACCAVMTIYFLPQCTQTHTNTFPALLPHLLSDCPIQMQPFAGDVPRKCCPVIVSLCLPVVR